MAVATIRVAKITHAQAIRLPGDEFNSVQIDGLDERGDAVRVILQPAALKAMRPVIETKVAGSGIDTPPQRP
jgi:hypothetical protein